MKKLILILLLIPKLCFATSISFQEGTDGYTGCVDGQIKENAATTNYGTSATMEATYWAAGDSTNFLIKWDLSSIPAGSTINSVQIDIIQSGVVGADVISCHRLLRNWVVSEATWNIYSTGNSWSTAGGSNDLDRSSTVSASLSVGDTTGTKSWLTTAQLVSDVQNFVDGTQSNYGWWFTSAQNGSHYHIFRSSNDATATNRPKITIDYTAGAEPSVSGERRRVVIIE